MGKAEKITEISVKSILKCSKLYIKCEKDKGDQNDEV